MIFSSLVLPPPPPLLSPLSPFTYLACPTIARHILLGYHGWLIVVFKDGYFLIRSVTTNNYQPQRQLGEPDLPFTCGGLNNKIQQLYSMSIKKNYQLISPTIMLPIIALYLPTIT
jgi:hypothetical protein